MRSLMNEYDLIQREIDISPRASGPQEILGLLGFAVATFHRILPQLCSKPEIVSCFDRGWVMSQVEKQLLKLIQNARSSWDFRLALETRAILIDGR